MHFIYYSTKIDTQYFKHGIYWADTLRGWWIYNDSSTEIFQKDTVKFADQINTWELNLRSNCCYSEKNILNSSLLLNPLTPNDPYRGRTAPLTSKHCILYIYSTNIVLNILNILYTLPFSLQNAVCFIILTYLVPYYSHFICRVC